MHARAGCVRRRGDRSGVDRRRSRCARLGSLGVRRGRGSRARGIASRARRVHPLHGRGLSVALRRRGRRGAPVGAVELRLLLPPVCARCLPIARVVARRSAVGGLDRGHGRNGRLGDRPSQPAGAPADERPSGRALTALVAGRPARLVRDRNGRPALSPSRATLRSSHRSAFGGGAERISAQPSRGANSGTQIARRASQHTIVTVLRAPRRYRHARGRRALKPHPGGGRRFASRL
jgi:hypothetical protein